MVSLMRFLLLAALLFCAAGRTLAQADGFPPNDDFDHRAILPTSNAVAVAASNAGATSETGEPAVWPGARGATVWFQWTPPTTGNYLITTDGSSFDTVLAVFTGNGVTNLILVAADDDGVNPAGSSGTSLIALTNALAGSAYQIAVDTLAGKPGTIHLAILPNNDSFDDRIVLTGAPLTTISYNGQAGREPYEHNHATGAINRSTNAPGKTVWWEWHPSIPGTYWVSTYPATFPSVISVYRATGLGLTNLLKMASDTRTDWAGDLTFDTFGNLAAVIVVDTNETYRIAVDGQEWVAGGVTNIHCGRITLSIQRANDQLTNAAPLSGTGLLAVGFNGLATSEAGEFAQTTAAQDDPFNPQYFARHSVWWRWSPPRNGDYLVTTQGSPFDTFLGVMTNAVNPPTITGLAWAAESGTSNDNGAGPGGFSSLVALKNARTNQTYYLLVDGAYDPNRDNFGAIHLSIVPDNNHAANRIRLTGAQATGISYNGLATAETGELLPPNPDTDSRTVWWGWVAPSNGVLTLDTAPASFVTLLGVWTGSAPDFSDYQLLAWDVYGTNDFRSRVSLPVRAGQEYQIQVTGIAATEYGEAAMNLNFEAVTGPPNITSVTLDANQQLQLDFPALPGFPYQLHFADHLGQPWQPGETVTATNRWMRWSLPVLPQIEKRFFRLSEAP